MPAASLIFCTGLALDGGVRGEEVIFAAGGREYRGRIKGDTFTPL